MKKELLLYFSIVVILVISVIISINNNEVRNLSITRDNVNIIYPYFSNDIVDKAISNYLGNELRNISNNSILNIDYDYQITDDGISIVFYKNITSGNVVNDYMDFLDYSYNDMVVYRSSNILENGKEYDTINNKVVDKNKPMVAFTFDDGPNYNTKRIIDILNKYNVHATFFVVGKNALKHENIIKYMYESGMDIGNHTYSHRELTKYKDSIIESEIEKTNDIIHDITDSYPVFLRPSYGSTNRRVKKVANMPIVIWNLDTKDWKRHNSDYIMDKIINNVDDGDIILMHDIYSATVNAVDKVIPILLEMDYQIVSVKELFYYKGREYVNGKVYSRIR